MPTAVERLLGEFVGGGWEFVRSLPEERRQETLHLDFKLKEDPAKGRDDRTDRKYLSIALSGFANGEGGLLVWGVDARPVEDADVVQSVQPISGLEVFHSRCRTLIPELVSPYVEATLHAIPDPADPSRGVLVVAVPESDSTPHMATGPGLHSYFRRSGHSFRKMEHNEVADMFGRRPHPKLRVEIGLRVGVSGSAGGVRRGNLSMKFVLQNEGRGLLRFPCLSLKQPQGWTTPPMHRVNTPILERLPGPGDWWLRIVQGGDYVVYPDDEVDAAELHFDLREDRTEYPDLSIDFDAVAADCPHVRGTVRAEGEDIYKAWLLALDTRELVKVPLVMAD